MDTSALHARLTAICEEITHGEYDKAKAIFELPLCGGHEVNVLAEALGMMLVRIEAREFELGRAIAALTSTREDLVWHKERLAQENNRLRAELRRKAEGVRPVATAPAMLFLLRQAERAAMVDATLLLTGETGTGKGLFARHIHDLSTRAGKPFVVINCAAIPASLLESELFGIEAGVASGVQARAGRFEQAAHGTILLDEIGDMPLESQAKLLHVIETGQVERVGGRKPIDVGVRIMAATHRDLGKRVEEGLFRADLFYRLNVMPLHVPPLRERREDIPFLVRLFLTRIAERSSLAASSLSREALDLLMRYNWPGNIRELENELERAALMAESVQISPSDLSPMLRGAPAGSFANADGHAHAPGKGFSALSQDEQARLSGAAPVGAPACWPPEAVDNCTQGGIPTLAQVELAHIKAVLARLGGNKSRAARILGISREGLRVKLQKNGQN